MGRFSRSDQTRKRGEGDGDLVYPLPSPPTSFPTSPRQWATWCGYLWPHVTHVTRWRQRPTARTPPPPHGSLCRTATPEAAGTRLAHLTRDHGADHVIVVPELRPYWSRFSGLATLSGAGRGAPTNATPVHLDCRHMRLTSSY